MFKIGEFSKLSGLSPDTLYHYEKMGILKPRQVDSVNGYRRYEADQLVIVNKVLALKDAGLSLAEIAEIQMRDIPAADLIQMLELKASDLETQLLRETHRLERLHSNIFMIKNGGIPMVNEITVKQVEPILVASIRRTMKKADFDSELDVMWPDVNTYIKQKGGKLTIPCIMLYHKGWTDLETWQGTPESAQLDVEVAEPLREPIESGQEVNVYSLPREEMACIVHQGPFSTIGESNEKLFCWIRDNGYKVTGPMREIYHKGDWLTDNPEEYVTEMQIPVQRGAR